jgi:cytochrome c oxidase subunit 1
MKLRPVVQPDLRPTGAPRAAVRQPRGALFLAVLRTTDHKTIGKLYLCTSFGFFFLAGAMAMLMRAELARPGRQFLSQEQYNELFTIHGTVMLLLFATPLAFAFANLVLPLQIGSPDVAFPRLNALSYWLFLFGGLIVVGGLLTPDGASWRRAGPRRSAGTRTRRSPRRPTRRASALTCGSWAWRCPVSAPSSAR